MADLTSRYKIPIPAAENTTWLENLTHWAELNDVMFTVLSNKDYVISGLVVSTSPSSLNFSYGEGSLSINSATVNISSGAGSVQPDSFNWVYVQSGQIVVSTYPPTGISYVPIACLQTDSTGVTGNADLRPSPPTVNGISINPLQVNPTSDINMAASKRIIHADTNVGSNTLMFPNAQVQTLLNWGNQTNAKAWTELNLTAYVATTARFAILNCYIATDNADRDGWAVLEVKTSLAHDNNVYNFVDYGHPIANVLNASQVGNVNQIILPITTDKKFQVRSLVDGLRAGVYYASIKLMGYVT